jgi:DHA1 family bicyclomycin/chloramphenicol resistance-like MFS transporter
MADETSLTAAPQSNLRRFVTFLALGGLTAVPPASTDIYTPAFPDVTRTLHTSASSVQLTLSVSLIGLGIGQLVAGPLSDRLGRRRPVVIGMVLYTLSSLGCAVAPSIGVLAALRLIQGLAGASGVVIARAVIQDLNPGTSSARVFSRLVLVTGLATVFAPSIGAGVLRITDWRGIFVLLSVLGVLLTVAARFVVPQRSGDEHVVGLVQVLRTFGHLMSDRYFLGYGLCNCFSFAGMFAYIASFSFLVQNYYHQSATVYGLLFGLNSLSMVLFAQVNARVVTRMSPRRPLVFGLAVAAVASVALPVLLATVSTPLAVVETLMLVMMATRGFGQSNSTALAMARAASMRGSAAAALGALQFAVAAVSSPLTGLGGKHNPMPMAISICVASVIALGVVVVLTRDGERTTAVTSGVGAPGALAPSTH